VPGESNIVSSHETSLRTKTASCLHVARGDVPNGSPVDATGDTTYPMAASGHADGAHNRRGTAKLFPAAGFSELWHRI